MYANQNKETETKVAEVTEATVEIPVVEVVHDYMVAPIKQGSLTYFPQVIKRNLVLSYLGANYQIRIDQERDPSKSYAGLYRWSHAKEDWSTIATCKPESDFGIAPMGGRYDREAYKKIEDDLILALKLFEETFHPEVQAILASLEQ